MATDLLSVTTKWWWGFSPPRETYASKRVYVKTTGNWTMITLMGCRSATGNFVPPALVFPGKKLTKNMIKDAPVELQLCVQRMVTSEECKSRMLKKNARTENGKARNEIYCVVRMAKLAWRAQWRTPKGVRQTLSRLGEFFRKIKKPHCCWVQQHQLPVLVQNMILIMTIDELLSHPSNNKE